MPRVSYDVFMRECPSRAVLDLLADKWTLLLICALKGGPRRFGGLRRQIDGVTQKMLTQTLRALERNGLVSRAVYDTTPPSVEYRLTALGDSTTTLMGQMCEWAQGHVKSVVQAQARYDARVAAAREPVPGVRRVASGQVARRAAATSR